MRVFSWAYALRNISKKGFGPILLSTTRGRVRCAGFTALLHSLSVHFGNCRRTPWCTTTRQWTTYQHRQWIISEMLSTESSAPEGQSLVRYGKGRETLCSVFIVLGSWCQWNILVKVSCGCRKRREYDPVSALREWDQRTESQSRGERARKIVQKEAKVDKQEATLTKQLQQRLDSDVAVITTWYHKAAPSSLETEKVCKVSPLWRVWWHSF